MPGKTRILMIEDETSAAFFMVMLLTRAGCEIEVAAIPEKGIHLAEQGDFDLITLDVGLPGSNGFEIYRLLKEIPALRQTPIVFISAHCTLEDQQHGLDLGAADFITKPLETWEFAPRLLSHVKPRKN